MAQGKGQPKKSNMKIGKKKMISVSLANFTPASLKEMC